MNSNKSIQRVYSKQEEELTRSLFVLRWLGIEFLDLVDAILSAFMVGIRSIYTVWHNSWILLSHLYTSLTFLTFDTNQPKGNCYIQSNKQKTQIKQQLQKKKGNT